MANCKYGYNCNYLHLPEYKGTTIPHDVLVARQEKILRKNMLRAIKDVVPTDGDNLA